jgi:hypothetical protein
MTPDVGPSALLKGRISSGGAPLLRRHHSRGEPMPVEVKCPECPHLDTARPCECSLPRQWEGDRAGHLQRDRLALVSACPDRGRVLPVSMQPPGCPRCELSECLAGKGKTAGRVSLRECLECLAEVSEKRSTYRSASEP